MPSSDHYRFEYKCFAGEERKLADLVNYELLDFTLNLKHQVCIQQQETLTTYLLYERHLNIHTSSQDFFQDGMTNFRMMVEQSALPDEVIHAIMTHVISYVRQFLEFCTLNNSAENFLASINTLHLHLDLTVDSFFDEDEIMDMAILGSMNEIGMIPASQEAIDSLKKVNIEINEETKQCIICLEEFDNDSEVLDMPCKHVYHQQCITQWLKTSHMCPLCRYPMPI